VALTTLTAARTPTAALTWLGGPVTVAFTALTLALA